MCRALFVLLPILGLTFFDPTVVSGDPGPSSPTCKRLDAAISYHGTDYLFFGPEYIEVSQDGEKEDIKNSDHEWGGLPEIDAALIWADDGYPYFFKGDKYFYYSAWRFKTYGPYPPSDWNEKLHLEKGLDAAGSIGYTSYFFKGCKYIVYDEGEYKDPASLEDLGIPCDLDAAFLLTDDELAVIKFDQLWTINNTRFVSGPRDANAELNLQSIRLCGENEDVKAEAEEAADEKVDESKDEKADEAKDEKADEAKDEKADEAKDEKADEAKDEKVDESKDEKADEAKEEKADEAKDEKADEAKEESAE